MSLPLSHSTPYSLRISINSVFIIRKINISALNGEACSSDSECLDPKAHCNLLGSLTCVCNSGFLLSNIDNTCKGLPWSLLRLLFPRFYNRLKLDRYLYSNHQWAIVFVHLPVCQSIFCWYWELSFLQKGIDDSMKKNDQSCLPSKSCCFAWFKLSLEYLD